MTFDLIKAKMSEVCEPYTGFIAHVCSQTNAVVMVPSAPPAIDDVLAIPGGTSSPELDEMVRELGVAPAALRRKFWKVCEEIFKETCERHGATFIPVPGETINESGFRRRKYWGSDWLHANAEYGELVLRQVDNLVAQ